MAKLLQVKREIERNFVSFTAVKASQFRIHQGLRNKPTGQALRGMGVKHITCCRQRLQKDRKPPSLGYSRVSEDLPTGQASKGMGMNGT